MLFYSCSLFCYSSDSDQNVPQVSSHDKLFLALYLLVLKQRQQQQMKRNKNISIFSFNVLLCELHCSSLSFRLFFFCFTASSVCTSHSIIATVLMLMVICARVSMHCIAREKITSNEIFFFLFSVLNDGASAYIVELCIV